MPTAKQYDNNRFEQLYNMYIHKEITKKDMADKLGITTPTLTKRIKEYLKANEPNDNMIDSANNQMCEFYNPNFGTVRTVEINSVIWFIGKDVAEILGYSNTRDALAKHVDTEDKGVANCDTPGGKQKLVIINESGVYALIFGSKLSTAKEFKHWVTSEVLPSIRKHGVYMTPQTIEKILLDPDLIIKLATNLKEEQEKNKKIICG